VANFTFAEKYWMLWRFPDTVDTIPEKMHVLHAWPLLDAATANPEWTQFRVAVADAMRGLTQPTVSTEWTQFRVAVADAMRGLTQPTVATEWAQFREAVADAFTEDATMAALVGARIYTSPPVVLPTMPMIVLDFSGVPQSDYPEKIWLADVEVSIFATSKDELDLIQDAIFVWMRDGESPADLSTDTLFVKSWKCVSINQDITVESEEDDKDFLFIRVINFSSIFMGDFA